MLPTVLFRRIVPDFIIETVGPSDRSARAPSPTVFFGERKDRPFCKKLKAPKKRSQEAPAKACGFCRGFPLIAYGDARRGAGAAADGIAQIHFSAKSTFHLPDSPPSLFHVLAPFKKTAQAFLPSRTF